jgi:hypothetical protein
LLAAGPGAFCVTDRGYLDARSTVPLARVLRQHGRGPCWAIAGAPVYPHPKTRSPGSMYNISHWRNPMFSKPTAFAATLPAADLGDNRCRRVSVARAGEG